MPATQKSRERAYYVPFLVFIAFLYLGDIIGSLSKSQSWFITDPQYWIKPAQTIICGALLAMYWRHYGLGEGWRSSRTWFWGLGAGLLAFILWIAPVAVLGAQPRLKDGFNPAFFGGEGWPFFLNLSFRFLRLVIIVPLVEEIFWRGFLLRWLVNEKFLSVPFGTYTLKAFALVALFFMFEHSTIDYPAALLTGLLYNAVAVRTMHLSACVLAHGVTNLLLGLYIMRTGQWGFW